MDLVCGDADRVAADGKPVQTGQSADSAALSERRQAACLVGLFSARFSSFCCCGFGRPADAGRGLLMPAVSEWLPRPPRQPRRRRGRIKKTGSVAAVRLFSCSQPGGERRFFQMACGSGENDHLAERRERQCDVFSTPPRAALRRPGLSIRPLAMAVSDWRL